MRIHYIHIIPNINTYMHACAYARKIKEGTKN